MWAQMSPLSDPELQWSTEMKYPAEIMLPRAQLPGGEGGVEEVSWHHYV